MSTSCLHLCERFLPHQNCFKSAALFQKFSKECNLMLPLSHSNSNLISIPAEAELLVRACRTSSQTAHLLQSKNGASFLTFRLEVNCQPAQGSYSSTAAYLPDQNSLFVQHFILSGGVRLCSCKYEQPLSAVATIDYFSI